MIAQLASAAAKNLLSHIFQRLTGRVNKQLNRAARELAGDHITRD